uniref:Uncharacterized protein n=1 Tax=Podoviridae sp. ctoqT5 TaxID=2826577 RepID=A0A8S5MQ73_9CAUD|nr:MAG TPA: hypothetical protein [Podoviridae sp. ctoqT5]
MGHRKGIDMERIGEIKKDRIEEIDRLIEGLEELKSEL